MKEKIRRIKDEAHSFSVRFVFFIVILSAAAILLLTGCGNGKINVMPKDAIVFIAEVYTVAAYHIRGIMEQFNFWRALDTVGKTMETPDYIDSLQYNR